MNDMVNINCNLCNHNDFVVICNGGIPYHRRVRNVICKQCGLVYQNPIMGPKALQAYYANYRKITIGLQEPTKEYEQGSQKMSRYHYSFFKEYCRPGMNILDVGCGAGTLMHWAVLDGLTAYGVNPDAGFGNYGPAHYGLKEVQICLFEDSTFHQGMFDIVTLNHVFEHFTDATAMLGKIRSLLRPNGFLYLSIPNALTPHGQLEYNFFLEHVNTFSEKTIGLLLKKMGFKIIKFSSFGYITDNALHHPYIDLVAQKLDLTTPQTIDWQSGREDYRQVAEILEKYQKEFMQNNGYVKVCLGNIKRWLHEHAHHNSRLMSLYDKYFKIFGSALNKYVHTEPDYCVAPITTEFPVDKCVYYK